MLKWFKFLNYHTKTDYINQFLWDILLKYTVKMLLKNKLILPRVRSFSHSCHQNKYTCNQWMVLNPFYVYAYSYLKIRDVLKIPSEYHCVDIDKACHPVTGPPMINLLLFHALKWWRRYCCDSFDKTYGTTRDLN